jgi:hypothetical protein
MASGHVNRANRPNTWLHRPATRREDSPCQLGAVHTWHFVLGALVALLAVVELWQDWNLSDKELAQHGQ